ncbi:HAD family acid phosphatase [Sphingomonas sp. BK235]|uniref:HAD family acid phosphatase n=1 Tax=Sphingomonas sp. BK235 TaxID=2512131 RepID=UPI0010DBF0DB|nr:HAD family acid phosphatase [Sphingomonas sp. BK235]TCP32889.1 5'-nucleotidase (lipoprotein e(P4) family) [Sphingomonas sp. BK235]
MSSRLLGAAAGALLLAGCAAAAFDRAPPRATSVAAETPAAAALPAGAMAYLYGSAEAAALSEQTYNALTGYVRGVIERARDRRGRLPSERRAGTLPRWPQSAVLAPGATAASVETVPCGALPPAVVLDMDETAVLNLGYEFDEARTGAPYDAKRWDRWERTGADRVVAVPGAVAAFRQLRALGVTMVINTNRSADNASATAAALRKAGLGEFRRGDTLYLKGDVDGRSGKDGRRLEISKHYCVLALVGDQLGDFADLFNPPGPAPALGRRALAGVGPIQARWGQGWFVLPNPVYGTGLGTGWDETFPQDKRWGDAPAEGAK